MMKNNLYLFLFTFCFLDTAYSLPLPIPIAIGTIGMPTADFTTVETYLCPGRCITYSNTSQNATSYQWTFEGANPTSSTSQNPKPVCYNTPGTYDVILIATNGNGSDTLIISDYINVFPFPAPLSIIQQEDTIVASQDFVSYQWYFNGNVIPGATDYFFVTAQTGSYSVIAVDNNGCESQAALIGISELNNGIELFLSPNPTTSTVTIHLSSYQQYVKVEIYNVHGERIYSSDTDRELLTVILCLQTI